jgi:hypothetical protein
VWHVDLFLLHKIIIVKANNLLLSGFNGFFEKAVGKKQNWCIFATPKGNGCVAQLNRASDYGSEGFRFES